MREPIADELLRWYRQVRRDLPWRRTKDPYSIWISEIMLQQTRVETVKEYYRRFLARFPTAEALAEAPEQDVLKLWEGLGYYSRARNLQKAAREIVTERGGAFPHAYGELLTLSGIGPYTAGAIASIAFGEAVPAIDGNVSRVGARYFGIREEIASPRVQRLLRERLTAVLPADAPGDFNQALMELGATVCLPAAPKCELCPLRASCDARAEGDAALLPIHERKAAPRPIDMAVCLLTYRGRVLALKRKERMLGGLYVFLLMEDIADENALREALYERDLPVDALRAVGTAKHVFTHRVWNMTLWHGALTDEPDAALLRALDARMVTAEELAALPLPTAMRAAKEKALALPG